ncbi:unnamed protein product [Clonostachys rosea]|uniref:CCHC-type domain-containing protein n=1 Tax=Bionectria ochroleuca TaxID=29856 RepID=A0ABY6UPW5_BIOOC|nr:unnamed protein product [Clonostachys rosea]
MADPPGHNPDRPEEEDAFCYNCERSGHWPIVCPEDTHKASAANEPSRNSSHGAQRSGKDHNRGGNRRSSAPIITRYEPQTGKELHQYPPGYNPAPPAPYEAQSSQELHQYPPGYNPAPPAPYEAQSSQELHQYPPGYNPAPPTPYTAQSIQFAASSATQNFPQYPPQAHYAPSSYPPGYQVSSAVTQMPTSYGPPPSGHQLTNVPPVTTPTPTAQAHQGGYQPQAAASFYAQHYGSYPPPPQPVHSGPPGLGQAAGHFGGHSAKPVHGPGGSHKQHFSGGSNPKKQQNQAPQSKPLVPPTASGEGIVHALPPRPPVKKLPHIPPSLHSSSAYVPPAPTYMNYPPGNHLSLDYIPVANYHSTNQDRLDRQRNQRSKKHQERHQTNRDKGKQNGGANNRRGSNQRKQNLGNKSNSPRFRKRFQDGALAEESKSITTSEASPTRLEPEVQSNEALTPLKTPEPESKDKELPAEGDSGNQEVAEPHRQEQADFADQPKENTDDVKDSSLNSDGGDVKPLPSDDPATKPVAEDIVEKDSTASPEEKISADKSGVEQEFVEATMSKTPNTGEESTDRQEAGRKHRRTEEEEDSSEDRLTKRRKSSGSESPRPKESLQVTETSHDPQSSEDNSLPVPLEEKLPSNRRDSILNSGSQPASRRSSISSKSSGLNSLEEEILNLGELKDESKEEEKKKKKQDGRGKGKKRQPKVNSAYSRRW